jgi:hypothetical protein
MAQEAETLRPVDDDRPPALRVGRRGGDGEEKEGEEKEGEGDEDGPRVRPPLPRPLPPGRGGEIT